MPIGLTLPLKSNQVTLGAITYTESHEEAAKVNLKALVLTNKGERAMHADMGCDLGRFLFEPPTDELIDAIKTTISDQVSAWLPYINIANIDVAFSDNEDIADSKIIGIKITFSLDESKYKLDTLEITVV